ncbi:MAG: signal recognition particle-docking protein FtsY [Myxococcales bacterium]|nr:signal recognition particle-docking protein FtsY [Myxococcales bacterium]
MSVYILYAAVAVLLLAAIFAVWQLSTRRRAPIAPPEEARSSPLPEARAGGGKLQLVPPEAKPAKVASPSQDAPTPLREGLARTRGGFIARLAGLLSKKKIDADLIEQIEEVLFTSDIGGKTAGKLLEAVRGRLDRNQLQDTDAVWEAIKEESRRLCTLEAPPIDLAKCRPFVVLTIGVNGAGKTTTIGKLAAQWVAEGKKVLLAAGDTFRAAATEQLEIWGERAGAPVVKGKPGSDPSAVIFDALKQAREQDYDVVIADTAGRLQTKTELMEELQKVRRVLKKADPTAPHETLLVLDATNGQNAISQAQIFKQVMEVTGIVLTKLDGTAKGGVILGICDELRVPVRYVGIGEKVSDLRAFDPGAFVDALYDRGTEASVA